MYLIRSMELFNFNFILYYYFITSDKLLQEGGERVKVCEEDFF